MSPPNSFSVKGFTFSWNVNKDVLIKANAAALSKKIKNIRCLLHLQFTAV